MSATWAAGVADTCGGGRLGRRRLRRGGGLALLLLADQLTELALDLTEELLEVGLGLRAASRASLGGLGVGVGGGLGVADTASS